MLEHEIRNLLARAGASVPVTGPSAEHTLSRAQRDRRSRTAFQGAAVAVITAAVVLGGLIWPGGGPSSGADPAGDGSVTVPGVTGLWRPDAEAALASAGLPTTIRTTNPSEHTDERPGTVLGQDPAAGSTVAAGSPVNLLVAAPTGLTCPSNLRSQGIFDVWDKNPPGDPSPLAAADGYADPANGETLIPHSRQKNSASVMVLRADGTAHTTVFLDVGGNGWYVTGQNSCSGGG